MSVAGLTWSAAAGIAPLLGGYLNDHIAPAATWYGGFLIGIIGILGFLILSRKQPGVQSSVLTE
jgi:MFS family permease